MTVDKSLLISGNAIPFPQSQLNITQPKMKNILLLGEKNFFQGCELITFSKDILKSKDKTLLKDSTNFDVLMSIINDKSEQAITIKDNCINILLLLFPEYKVDFQDSFILLMKENEIPRTISNENFEDLKLYIKDIFCLDRKKNDEKNYNPGGPRAEKLARRFQERQNKLAQLKGEDANITIFDKYLSVLSIGLPLDINVLLNYTIYQLYDAFERFTAKEAYDLSTQAKLAGAKSDSLDKTEHWMK